MRKEKRRKYPLLDTKWVDISIGDFPSKEPVRVFSMNYMKKKTQTQHNEETEISHPVISPRENSSWILSLLFSFSGSGAEREKVSREQDVRVE